MRVLLRHLWPLLFTAWPEVSVAGVQPIQISAVDGPYVFDQGDGLYRVKFNYTGEHWTHADVAAIVINTDKPIAVLPMQYTEPTAMQPGAKVDGKHIGKDWNTITQRAMAIRLEALGFFVLTPTITDYGENLAGFQALEHFIAGVHKGNDNVQTVLLTADADTPNSQNPVPGAQMLVTGIHKRNDAWERLLQMSMSDFYTSVRLNNLGARVRGGLSDEEGSSAAWHPLIERAAEYGSEVAIIEVARAVDIVAKAGSIEHGEEWAAPLFDALAEAMFAWTEHPATKPHR